MSRKIDEGVIRAPKMVFDEITAGSDRLAEWFRDREHRGLCINATDEVVKCVGTVSDFVVRKYGDRKAREFLAGADPFVIAHAMAMGEDGVVVSHESRREQTA